MIFRNQVFSLILLLIFTLIIFFIPTNKSFAEEEYIKYKVLKNDTLTKVLKSYSLKPIYGKSGSLEEVLKLNPQKQDTNGDLILIGEILLLPKNKVQVNLLNNTKPSQAIMKKEKSIPNLTPKDDLNKKQKLKNVEPQKQGSPSKEAVIFKETVKKTFQPQLKIVEKKTPEKLQLQTKTDLSKNMEHKNVFIPDKQPKPTKETVFNPNTQNNVQNSQTETEYITITKTQLPALPLKPDNIQATKETTVIQNQEVNSNIEMEYDFLLDISKFCSPNPSCKIWLWEPENKCCKPAKQYFLFFEKNSL